jgi:hypothetical protein
MTDRTPPRNNKLSLGNLPLACFMMGCFFILVGLFAPWNVDHRWVLALGLGLTFSPLIELALQLVQD